MTTNTFGLYTLAVGDGIIISGTMPSVDWSKEGVSSQKNLFKEKTK